MSLKAVLFDSDGMLMIGGMFSQHLARDYQVHIEALNPFFKNEFKDCLIGKADLKERIQKYLEPLGWQGSVDELLDYWFKSEHKMDERILGEIQRIRDEGIKCYLATNQEKYRTEYIRKVMGLEQIMDEIFSSAEMGYKKPQEEFFKMILDRLSPLRPDEIAYWDDSQENIEAARKLGIQAFHYKDFPEFEGQLHRLKERSGEGAEGRIVR